jgi:hypothetical protein
MWNQPSKAELAQLPGLYTTESLALKDKLIQMHFFLGGCDWYVVEFDGRDIFFGYVILNGDRDSAEWGNFSFNELKQLKDRLGIEVDRDLWWRIRPAGEIADIKTF